MLEQIRKNSRSVVVSILFSVLIFAFVISMNHTQARCSADLGSERDDAARISGREISQTEFFFAYSLSQAKQYASYFPSQEPRFRGQVLDALIERELLAQTAEGMGIHVSEEEASLFIQKGNAFVAGMPFSLKPSSKEEEGYGVGFKNGHFDYGQLERVLQQFGFSVRQFVEMQQREIQAEQLRNILKIGIQVADGEVKQMFLDENTQVKLEYLRFSAPEIAQKLAPSPAVLEAYILAHDKELFSMYEQRKDSYQNRAKEVHLHRVVIVLDKEASAEKIKEAETTLTSMATTLRAGASFEQVMLSTPNLDVPYAGNMGFVAQGSSGLEPDQEVAVFASKPGELLGPKRTKQGFELIQVDEFRQGNISYDGAKKELALEKYRNDTSKELAKTFAVEAGSLPKSTKLSDFVAHPPASAIELQKASGVSKLEHTDFIERRGDVVQGIGASKELVKAIFSKRVLERVGPIEIGGAWYVVEIQDKKEPAPADFDAKKDSVLRKLQAEKSAEALKRFVAEQCKNKKQASELKVNMALFETKDANPKGQPDQFDMMFGGAFHYEPCQQNKGPSLF